MFQGINLLPLATVERNLQLCAEMAMLPKKQWTQRAVSYTHLDVYKRQLVDLFATILSGRRHLSARDADAALDILRYTCLLYTSRCV